MKDTIATFGCCTTRDIFRSAHTDYAKYFDIAFFNQRSSIISSMQPPVELDPAEVVILPHNRENDYRSHLVEDDLTKRFWEDLARTKPDYLIFDIAFDVVTGVLRINGKDYITNNYLDLPRTPLIKGAQIEILGCKESFEDFFPYGRITSPGSGNA